MSSLHVPVMPSPEYRRQLIEKALPGNAAWLVESMDHLFQMLLTSDMLLHPEIGNPIEHHIIVLKHLVAIVEEKPYDYCREALLMAGCLALLHDICPTPKIPREVIDAATDEENRKKLAAQRIANRRTHMHEGARIARDILEEMCAQEESPFDELLSHQAINDICRAISIHDNPTIGIPLPNDFTLAHELRESDRLWMVTNLGIRVDLSRRSVDPDDPDAFIEQAQRNIGKFMGERQIYQDMEQHEFRDPYTFFHTKAGHELYCRYCADILQYGALQHDYVRND